MRKPAVTIKDIARELGISPSTVSRALNDNYEISEETKIAVREVAERMNYQPNSLALSLRSRKSNTIGVVIPEIVHFFFSTVISGIEDIAHSRGYNVIITQSNESLAREKENITTLFNSRVDGVLISISEETCDYKHIEALKENSVPLVFFDRIPPVKQTSSVTVNDFLGGYQATEHLLKRGYQRIAHLAGPSSLRIMKDRLAGYQKALEDARVPYDEGLVIFDKASDAEQAFEACSKLFSLKDPDAIFASNDVAAMGAVKAAERNGKNVPQDFGVVGFSNWQFTGFTNPTITTIGQPGYEIGQKATEILLKQIESNDDDQPVESLKLETELIVRESTRRR